MGPVTLPRIGCPADLDGSQAARPLRAHRSQARPPPQTLTAIPVSAMAAPAISVAVNATRSTFHNHTNAVATYTPPYAAYTRPDAAGCKLNNHTNSARLIAAG